MKSSSGIAPSAFSMLNERHPRLTRILAALFFLAGVALFLRIA